MKQIFYFLKKLHSFAGTILYFNLFGVALVSLFEGVGIVLLLPMLNSSGMVNVGTGSISHILKALPFHLNLTIILGIYVCLIIGQVLLYRSITIQNVKIQIGFINSLRLELYQSLLQANWLFFIKKRKSDLINSLTNELGRVSMGTNLTLQFSTSLIFTTIQVVLALWLSVKMTLFILVCGGLMAFFSREFIKKAKVLGGETSEISKNYLGEITDHFNGIKEVKSNSLEEFQYRWLVNWSRKVEYKQLEYIKLKMTSQFYYKVSLGVFLAVFIFLSMKIFKTEPEQLLLIIIIFSRLWPRFMNIQSNLEQIASTVPAFKKIIHLQEECQQYKEKSDQDFNSNKTLAIHKAIECRNIFFRYNQLEPTYTLQNVSLKIKANSMTAIVGHSGAGKSTLIDLIMGLIEPEKGEVLIDGVPLTSEKLIQVRNLVSYVPQDPFLFNGTIKENLKMFVPNATDEEIWESLEFSAASEFVRKLPQGLETLVGDRGVRLSGGERQRLVLARAILKKTSILVLDEATSALDAENEERIQQIFNKVKGKMTILVIAHRPSTIRDADQIILMNEGKSTIVSEVEEYRKVIRK